MTVKIRSFVFFSAALLLALTLAPAAAAAEEAPRHAYTLDFTLAADGKSYSGTETVHVVNNSGDTWTTLCFRDYAAVATLSSRDGYRDENGNEVFIEPNADSSHFTNLSDMTTGEVLTARRDGSDPSVVYIDLPTPLKSGESRAIRFDYSAELFHGRGNLCRWEETGVTFLNLGNFYPILTVYERGAWQAQPYDRDGEYFYSPISDYAVTLTAPKAYTVAASVLGVSVPEGESLRWSFAGESLRDFALCLSDDFKILTGTADGVAIHVYYPAGQEDLGQKALESAKSALTFFGTQFEYPYPYDTFTVALTKLNLSGMEFPGMTMIDRDASNFDSTVAHEVAHQWFYALVGSNSGAEPWLDETLSGFAELLWAERYNQGRCKQMLDFFGPLKPPHSLGWSVAEMGNDYSWTVYRHAPEFLYKLRAAMGAAAFDGALRQYVKTYAMGEAHTADFVDIFLKGCGQNNAVLPLMEEYLFPYYADMAGNPAQSAAALTSAYDLFRGTSAGTFSPDLTMTRAQAVTVLYRLSGYPAAAVSAAFADVAADSWYAKAVFWAAGSGVTNGVGNGAFAPDRTVTQDEFLMLLKRCGFTAASAGSADTLPLTRAQAALLLAELLPSIS